MAKLEEREPTGSHLLPPALPPAPVAPKRDDSRAIPLMVEVHGRWGWDELKPKLWKIVPWLLTAGAALPHIINGLKWLAAHGQ